MNNYKKALIIPIWSAFLMLPFMGIMKAAIGGVIILAGFILFSGITKYAESDAGKKASAGIHLRVNNIHSFIERPQIKKGAVMLILLLLIIVALLSALCGTMLGVITLRLRGDYLAIVTLGFLMIVHLILNNWDGLTHGPNGILGIDPPSLGGFTLSSPVHFYYLILLLAGLAVFVISRINNSRTGRAWIAMREDEIAASAMGINVTYMKILAFALGASWAGLAGVFFAGRYAFISPESFNFFETVLVLSMVVLGGMGSITGVIIVAVLPIILPEVFRGFHDYRMLAFGGAMTLMMIFRPQGLIGNPRRKIELMPAKERI